MKSSTEGTEGCVHVWGQVASEVASEIQALKAEPIVQPPMYFAPPPVRLSSPCPHAILHLPSRQTKPCFANIAFNFPRMKKMADCNSVQVHMQLIFVANSHVREY